MTCRPQRWIALLEIIKENTMHNESRSKFKVQRLKAIDWSLLHVINDVVEEVETSKTVASPSSERMYDSI